MEYALNKLTVAIWGLSIAVVLSALVHLVLVFVGRDYQYLGKAPLPPIQTPRVQALASNKPSLSLKALYEQGDMQVFYKHAARLQKIDSDNPSTYYYLGLMYIDEGDLGRALLQLEKAVALDPDWLEAMQKYQEVCAYLDCND